MHRKRTDSYPDTYYELFDDLQADLQKWNTGGVLIHVAGEHGCHVEWNPLLLHADRDLYKETGAAYRRRLQNQPLT